MAQSQKSRSADARARAQARREEIRKQEQRRKRGIWLASGAGGVVVIAVAVFLIIATVGGNSSTTSVTVAAPPSVAADVGGVPAATYESVGVGTTGVSSGSSTSSGIQSLTPPGTPITTDGKPTFVYVGGEFCPYCAAERWAMATALARFGTLSGLQTTKSAGEPESYPNTATLSFATAKFASKYLAFSPAEVSDRAQKKFQTPTAAAEAAFQKYDPKGGIPFLSINNQYIGSAQFDPGVLKGLSADQIGADLKDPTSAVAKAVIGSANVLTAGICATTGQQPAAVCSTSAVKAAASALTSSTNSGSTTGSG